MRQISSLLFFLLLATPALAESHVDSGESDGDSGESSEEEQSEGQEGESSSSSNDETADQAASGPDEAVSAPEAGSEEPAAEDSASEVPATTPTEDETVEWEVDETEPAAEASGSKKSKIPEWMTSRIPIQLKLPGDVTIRPVARVQARVTIFDEDDAERNDPVVYGDPGLREGVSLRRVRLGVDADWRGLLGVTVVAGFDNRYDYTEAFGDAPSLIEASFSVSPLQEVGVSVGLDRVPFGRQAMTSSASLALWERAIASEHMAPDREAGVFLGGSFGPEANKVLGDNAVSWAFGVSNGGGDWTGDADPSPRLAGRASLDLGSAWEQVESGWTPNGFGLSVGGSLSHNWGLEADTLLAGADIGMRIGRFGIQGEFMVSNSVPTFDTEGIPDQLVERTALGGYGQVVFAILPGTLEVAARAGGYDDNTSLSDAGDRLDIAGGVNFYLFGGRMKAQLDFVHRMELVETHATSNDSLILQVEAAL